MAVRAQLVNGKTKWILLRDSVDIENFYGLPQRTFKGRSYVELTYHSGNKVMELGWDISDELLDAIMCITENMLMPLVLPQDIKYSTTLTPFPTQKKNIMLLAAKEMKCLFSDVGTGKTAMCLTLMNSRPDLKFLVITRNAIRYSWLYERDKFFPELDLGTYKDRSKPGKTRINQVKEHRNIVVSYNALSQKFFGEWINDYSPDVVICDESHNIKNRLAQTRYIRMKEMFYPRAVFYMATATPMPREYLDVYTQYFLAYYGYPIKYLDQIYQRYYFKINVEDREVHLPKLELSNDFRTRFIAPFAAVGEKPANLPALHYHDIPVEMSAAQERAYNQAKEEMIAELPSRNALLVNSLQQTSYLFRIATGFLSDGVTGEITRYPTPFRFEALQYILDRHPDSKVIIWCHFKENVRMVCEYLASKGEKYTFTHGGMDHSAAIAEFRDGDARIIVATYGTISSGLNLQFANISIKFTIPIEAKNSYQSDGRIHRTGQTKECHIYTLFSRGTFEEKFSKVCLQRVNMNKDVHSIGRVKLINMV